MAQTKSTLQAAAGTVTPADVHATLARHMLADGFDIVVDIGRSKGSYLFDARHGKRYLDFFTFFSSGSVGFNHPKLVEPSFLKELTGSAIHKPSNSDVYTVQMAEFVKTFGEVVMPSYLPHAFFIDGGALAVENGLKAAFDWKVKKNFRKGYSAEKGHQVIHFRQAFHGRSGYTLSLTNTDPTKTNFFPKFAWPRIHNPAIHFPLTDESLENVKREEALAISQITQAINENRDDIAVLIIEAIQAEGGDHHFRKEFLVELRRICDENEILFMIDEVQTGIAITGKMWAHEYFVKPDLMSFGKKTQVCGVLAGPRIDEIEDNVFRVPSRINSTFGGNLVDMVRFRRIMEIIRDEALVQNCATVGSQMLARLELLQSEFPTLVSNARGRGLFCAIDLEDGVHRDRLRKLAFEQGLILIGCGVRSIRFRPPITISSDEVDEGITIIRSSLERMAKDKTAS